MNAVAAGGEETRHPTDRLRTATVTLLLADAAFTVWAGFAVLSGPDETWRGWFLAALALAHLALGLSFLVRHGDRHPFGLIVAATGVATLTMAAPVQFGGPPVPIAWAAEAVALAWVAVLRRHPYSAAVGLILGAMAIAHLVGIEYRPIDLEAGFDRTFPFVGAEGMTFGFLLAALLVAAVVVPVRWVRVGFAAVGGLLTWYVLAFELSGPALVAAWALLAVTAVAFMTIVVGPRLPVGFVERRSGVLAVPRAAGLAVDVTIRTASRLVRPAIVAIAGLAGASAIGHLVIFDFPLDRLGDEILSTVPYVGPESLSLAAVLVALAIGGWLVRDRSAWLGAAGIGLALLVYSVTFEVQRPGVLAAWAVGGLAALALVRRVAPVDPTVRVTGSVPAFVAERLAYVAAMLALLFMAAQSLWYASPEPFLRHLVADVGPAASPFLDTRTLALSIGALTALVSGWVWTGKIARLAGVVVAALVVAWLLPFEIRPAYAVAGWALLVVGGVALIRAEPAGLLLVGAPAVLVGALGAVVALVVVAPPHRLVVDASTVVVGWPVLTDATVALGAMAIGLAAGSRLLRVEPWSRDAMIAAGVVTVYLLSVGLVDAFQQQVASRVLEELQKEAQVGLSVLWAALGLGGFATGLVVHRPVIRLSGLALLGLATVKVFLVDLAALDVAYRVLSLVVLGVLLLISASVYSRLQHPHPPTSPKAA